jgi:hypothetical protein
VLRADVEQRQLTAAERWLADFDHHLDQVAGNAQRTRSNYLRYARRFLTECFGIEAPNWSVLQSEQVTEFVRSEASNWSSTVSGLVFWDDQVLERLRGRFLFGDLKM